MDDEEKKSGHGGKRPGSGRKKGKVYPTSVKRFSGMMPVAMWDALDEAAAEARKRRSRYIDLLIAAVIREEIDIDIDPNSLPADQMAKWFALTNTQDVRGGYFSMRLQTLEDLESLVARMGWSRIMTLRNIFASQLILPPEERVRLDQLTPRKRAARPVVPTENPFIHRPIEEAKHPDDAGIFWDYRLPIMDPETGEYEYPFKRKRKVDVPLWDYQIPDQKKDEK